MTRPSRRELEQVIDDLDTDSGLPAGYRLLVYENVETGEWYPDRASARTCDGEPLDKATTEPATVIELEVEP